MGFFAYFLCLLSISEHTLFLLFIAISYLYKLTKQSQANVKYNEKESRKVVKERKLATSSPMGHILTGLASSSVSSTKKHATTSAASAAAIAALVCVTRVLSIKRTPLKPLHNVSAC